MKLKMRNDKFILLFFMFFIFSNISFAKVDNLKLTFSEKKDTCFLQYTKNNNIKKLRLWFPFMDSAYFINGIVISKNNKVSITNNIDFDSFLVFTIQGTTFLSDFYCFLIDTKNDSELNYLETGLPYYIYSENGYFINSNTLDYVNNSLKKTVLHYYKIEKGNFLMKKTKNIKFTTKQLDEKNFENNSLIQYIIN